MATSKITSSIERIVNNSANLLGRLQVGINKVLWGKVNEQPVQTVTFNTKTSSLDYKVKPPSTPQQPKGNLVTSGLFNALDALNSVDLCNVLTYATDNITAKKRPRPPKSEWSETQTLLYGLQDQTAVVQTYIDKYLAYPNVFIGSYVGTGPNVVPLEQAVAQSNAPAQGGTESAKYNLYFLIQAIREVFGSNRFLSQSILTAEERALLVVVPGLGGNLNIIDDFIGTVSRYSDYRQIPNQDLQKLQGKVLTVRSICVAIQNLDFQNALVAVGNILSSDIRSQIQTLSKYLDVTKIIPTLKQIVSAIRTFIKIGRQVYGVITLGQFLVKLILLFYKIFKFIIKFFSVLAIPLMFSTAGAQTLIQDQKEKAKTESDGLMDLLKGINAVLALALTFVRYVLANANELLIRLQTILTTLQNCNAVKDSDVIRELEQATAELKSFKEELESYITKYDSKTSPDNAIFGIYDIRVVDEELVDQTIRNKRRRGIALDNAGSIVAQSDLTFATNTAVIIEEVKQKLIAAGLVQPTLSQVDFVDLAIISESLNYLDNEDILQDDLNIEPVELDSPDNLNEESGLGLNAFINNLKGGKRLRQRVRRVVTQQTANIKSQVSSELSNSQQALKTGN